jgi:hypothetical protein
MTKKSRRLAGKKNTINFPVVRLYPMIVSEVGKRFLFFAAVKNYVSKRDWEGSFGFMLTIVCVISRGIKKEYF